MKKLTHAVMTALLIVSVAGTGVFAAGPDDTAQPVTQVEGPRKVPPPGADRAARESNRRERDRIIREFQQSVRDAEQKFKRDEKAASGLHGAERKAAMKKAGAEMKATIDKAKEKRDADMEPFGGPKHRPPKKKHRPEKRRDGKNKQNETTPVAPKTEEQKPADAQQQPQ